MKIRQVFAADMMREKVVFVTGGGSGINLGIAKNFAVVGADLAICGRSQERLDGAKAELEALGARVVARAADVRDPQALAEAMAATERSLGPIGVLVAGAAGNFVCAASEMSPNGFKTVVDIDLQGAFNASRLAFEQLRETRGCALFISAGQAMIPYPMQVHVGAAKAGIDNLMRNLALEWGRYGIRTASIVPGPIAGTEGMRRLGDPAIDERFQEMIPLGRYGSVDDIGQLAVFLASPLASYITGTRIVADGGQNLLGAGVWSQLHEGSKGAG